MSRRGRLGFVVACLLAFALIGALVTWSTPSIGPSSKAPATVTPAGLAVADLGGAGQLQALFNADQGVPRLVLALAPT